MKRIGLIVVFYIFWTASAAGFPESIFHKKPLATSTQQEAISYLNSITFLETSAYWPNIKPVPFLQNLRANITDIISIYPGRGTYFCGYGALTYLLLQDDPLGYVQTQITLYRTGKAQLGQSIFDPSAAIKKEAGLLKYKGLMDIHPADQMWFLTLADHYKGYLNIFNRRYDPGDEDKFWASVNYGKFNRMAKAILHYTIQSRGSDLIRPMINDLYEYMSEKLKHHKVVLYINNRIVHKKNHVAIKLGVPTHFIVLEQISKVNDIVTLVYWDYGGRTLLQLSASFLKKIIFGITAFSKNDNDVE